MNKIELKKAFEKEFEKISVSNELKSKTLNSISTHQNKKTSHIPYIRNFAAIFVVTLLCVSVFFTNNQKENQSISSDENKSESILELPTIENKTIKKSSSPLLKSTPQQPTNNRAFDSFGTISTKESTYLYTNNLEATATENNMDYQDNFI